jgi:hypothetical protein
LTLLKLFIPMAILSAHVRSKLHLTVSGSSRGVLEALEISRWTYSSHLSAEGLSWDIPGDAQVSSGAKSREKYNPPIICILPWTCFPLHLGTQASDNKAAPRDRGHRKGELHNLATASLRSRTGCRSHRSLPLLLGVKGRKG